MSEDYTEIPIDRLISGQPRWQSSCVYETIGHAIVDSRDHDWAIVYRWILIPKPGKRGYPRRSTWINKKAIAVYMHSEVWSRHNGPIPEGLTVDHKDQDTWNNRIDNLRLATISQQGFNKGLQSNNESGYKGVSFEASSGKYKAMIRCKPRRIYLGQFDTVEEAAAAYAKAARELHGEFVCLKSDI